MQIGRDLIAITENEFDRRQHKYLSSDPAIENENQVASTGEYLTKTYDFFYKADNYDPVFNEKLELEIGLTVQDALRHAIKVFNTMIK